MLNKAFSLIYVFLLIVLTIVFSLRISNITIDSSILSLLPTETQSKVSKNTIDTYTKRLDRQVVFLIKDNGDGVMRTRVINLVLLISIIGLVGCGKKEPEVVPQVGIRLI